MVEQAKSIVGNQMVFDIDWGSVGTIQRNQDDDEEIDASIKEAQDKLNQIDIGATKDVSFGSKALGYDAFNFQQGDSKIALDKYANFLKKKKIEVPDNNENQVYASKKLILERLPLMDQKDLKPEIYEIDIQGVSIGRSTKNKIALDDKHISGQHIKIFFQEQTYFIQDMGSTSGTFISTGKTAQILQQNDIYEIGYTEFIIEKLQNKGDKVTLDIRIRFSKDSSQKDQLHSFQIDNNKDFTIGKGNNCHFKLQDQLASDTHAKIMLNNSNVTIQDLDSRTGTWKRMSQSQKQSESIQVENDQIFKLYPYCFQVKLG